MYPIAISAVKAGLPLKQIVSHYFPFEKSHEAFTTNANDKPNVVKAVITY
jgi:threonine dehydrogenase-like Zn-dependent dehydrogenase